MSGIPGGHDEYRMRIPADRYQALLSRMNEPTTRATGVTPPLDPDGWVDRHGDVLYRYALLRLRDPETSAELVQETFLEAYRTRDAFAGRSTERTWLTAILRHRIIDHLRREQRHRSVPLPDDESRAAISSTFFDSHGRWKKPPADWGGRPEALLEAREFWAIVESCLGRLPNTLSTTFWLREIDGLSGEEVCVAAGISQANLWARLHRARLLLRHCLEKHWFEGGHEESTTGHDRKTQDAPGNDA